MFDITKKRALETAKIPLVNGDGSPMYDEAGNELSVTVHGPGSKLWQQADAERSRRRTARMEKRGKISAALDHAREDEVDFLCAITVSFNGWEYPGEFKTSGDMHRAAYDDDSIGFIRDHVHKEATDWSVFTKGSATS
jgi:hypothetical protein